jgi:hypothetical protein
MTDERTDDTGEQPRDGGAQPTIQLPAKIPLAADERGILPIIPRNTEEAARYAQALIRADMVPDSYRYDGKSAVKAQNAGLDVRDGDINASLVLAGVLKSLEIGLPPQTGLGTIYPINGRFTVYGDGAIALIQRDRVIAKHTKRRIGPGFPPDLPLGDWPDEYGWLVSFWRKGQSEPYFAEFTVRDARRPNLWLNTNRKPWINYPDRMLFNRARAFALRDGFADCLFGLGIREEIEDTLPDEDEPVTAGTRHRSAFDDEPETAALPKPETQVVTDLDGQRTADPLPADALDPNF